MFIVLYCCLLVMVQLLSLAWADLHNTESLWDLFQGSIIEFLLGYPIYYLGISKFSPQQGATFISCLDRLITTPKAFRYHLRA